MVNKPRLPILAEIFEAIIAAGGVPYLVGGGVRDQILGASSGEYPVPKDYDTEVFKLPTQKLQEILSQFGRVDQVGASFGVFKLRVDDLEFDFSIPRRESKSGTGHKGFIPEPDPDMSLKEAAARRDFTVNAMSISNRGEVLDYYGGEQDLKDGILRHTSEHFIEDSLRVLRAVSLASRYEFTMAPETIYLASRMREEYHLLPKERIRDEWYKWAKGKKPSAGLIILRQTGWHYLYPELAALIDTPQDPDWHPEGNVWNHTLHVVDSAASIAVLEQLEDFDRVVLVFAALCHDLAKPRTTTHEEDGHIRSRGHAPEGVTETRSFLSSIGAPAEIIAHVVPLVKEHLSHLSLDKNSNRGIRRLSVRLAPATIHQWVRVVEADHSGRPPLPVGNPAEWVLIKAEALGVLNNKPEKILMGRHLIEVGLTPGPTFKPILDAAYEAQLDGEFTGIMGAMQWLQRNYLEKERIHVDE